LLYLYLPNIKASLANYCDGSVTDDAVPTSELLFYDADFGPYHAPAKSYKTQQYVYFQIHFNIIT